MICIVTVEAEKAPFSFFCLPVTLFAKLSKFYQFYPPSRDDQKSCISNVFISHLMLTPAEALELTKPTEGFLCSLSANKHGISFEHFAISDYETKEVFFRIGGGDDDLTAGRFEIDVDLYAKDPMDTHRKIRYTLSEKVLRLPLINTSLTFKVSGNEPLPSFRMIERHYFEDELIKNYDFSFGFVIPGSTNTWDCCYRVPPLDDDLVDLIVDHPFETRSDSFYFVGDELVMHNKASYKYSRCNDGAVSVVASKDAKGIDLGALDVGAKVHQLDDEYKSELSGMMGEAKAGDEENYQSSKLTEGGERDKWSKESEYY